MAKRVLWAVFLTMFSLPFCRPGGNNNAQNTKNTETEICVCECPCDSANPPPSTTDIPALPDHATPTEGAKIGYDLGDFRVKDSLVIPKGAGHTEIDNIQHIESGIFKHVLRWRETWHDGDRSLDFGPYLQKGRAELGCLDGECEPMKNGQTWLIGTTILIPRNEFGGARSYIDAGQPVLHQSYLDIDVIRKNKYKITLKVFSNGLGSKSVPIREAKFKAGEWISLVIRIHFSKDGSYAMSVNNDDFVTREGLDTTRSKEGAKNHANTWGLYMKNGLGDCTIYTAMNFIKQIDDADA